MSSSSQGAKQPKNPHRDQERMLQGEPLPLLFRMASPSAMAFLVQAAVSISEVAFVGQLGTASLAAMGLMFPLMMLMQMLAGGAIGGAVSSSIARALGQKNIDRAEMLIWHALFISIAAGLFFFLVFQIGAPFFFDAVNATPEVRSLAQGYGDILFTGAVMMWLAAVLNSVFRGTGNMRLPAGLMIGLAGLQIPLSGGLILGWFGLPQLGLEGAAISVIITATISTLIQIVILFQGKSAIVLRWSHFKFQGELFADLAKVGAPASLSPFLTVFTMSMINKLIGVFGVAALAGYGIVARIEFLIIPMVFGIGSAMTAMVGINMGAGEVERSEKIGWTGGIAAMAISGVAGIVLAIFPEIWVSIFADDPEVIATASDCLRITGPFFGLYGLGLSLYFAYQGAGTVLWPVVANILRVCFTVGGAWICVHVLGWGPNAIYAAIGAGMSIYGILTAAMLKGGAWRKAV